MAQPAIKVVGLRDLRRDLRRLGPGALKELRSELRDSAQMVAAAAKPGARRRSGRFAGSIRGQGTNTGAVVRSRLPYANVVHWGGTTGPGHERGPGQGSVRISPHPVIPEAADRLEGRIVEELGDGLERLFGRHGFH